MAWLIEKARVNRNSGRKEAYWTLGWREEGGKVRTRSLGFCEKEEAKTALKVLEARLATGQSAEPTPTGSGSSAAEPSPEVPTLAAYFEETYLPVVKRDKAPKTYTSAKTSANALKPVLGARRLHEIGYRQVDAYITHRRGLGRRSKTVIIELAWLRSALQHAVNSGVITSVPPFPVIKNRDRRPHRFLSPEESERLLEALRPFDVQPHTVTRGRPPIPRDRLTYVAVLMALNLGMRRMEILTRGWEDVRWDQGTRGVLLVCAKPEIGYRVKTGHDRAIPLTPEMHDELLRLHAEKGRPEAGWIFPSPTDARRPREDFGTALDGACERAGLPRIHPHGLRHTWASRLAMAGVPRRTLMELGGWKEGRMLDEIYAHTTDAHKVEVMERMGVMAAGRKKERQDAE